MRNDRRCCAQKSEKQFVHSFATIYIIGDVVAIAVFDWYFQQQHQRSSRGREKKTEEKVWQEHVFTVEHVALSHEVRRVSLK